MGEPKLYASYVELVRERLGERERRQYIILPPLPESLATKVGHSATSFFTYFYRTQENAGHRAVWKYRRDTRNEFVNSLKSRIQASENSGYTVSPIVTCEVNPSEVAQLLDDPRTPYKIMQRLQRVAKAKHGYTI